MSIENPRIYDMKVWHMDDTKCGHEWIEEDGRVHCPVCMEISEIIDFGILSRDDVNRFQEWKRSRK